MPSRPRGRIAENQRKAQGRTVSGASGDMNPVERVYAAMVMVGLIGFAATLVWIAASG
jgi:hypothetical protein